MLSTLYKSIGEKSTRKYLVDKPNEKSILKVHQASIGRFENIREIR